MTSATTTEFQLTNEIKELGIARVYTGFNGRGEGEILLFIQRDGVEKPLSCTYHKRFKNVAKELESVLCNSGVDDKTAKKFIVLFGKVWFQTEKRQQQTQRDKILQEIRARREQANFSSVEEWQIALNSKYETLRQVVKENIPEIWTGLEFELSVLRILNLYGNTLPFIGLFLARPGSYKTQTISLLQDWYCTYYTDDFTAKSFVSHSTAVSEEELEDIDMLPRIKNRLFLTPELAPIFTVKEEDLVKTLGIITRIADGHGYQSNSGAHGRRGYGSQTDKLMFTWLGAAVDIPYRVYKMLGNLGFKLYFFRLPFKESTKNDLFLGMSEDFETKISKIKSALCDYLYLFETGPHLIYDNELLKVKWDTSQDDYSAKKSIVELGVLLQHLRCIATTWHTEGTQDSDYGYTVSQPEDPKRAIRVLYNLAKGHALLTGRNYIILDDIPIVVKTVLSTAMIERVGLLYLLINNGGDVSTDDIISNLHVTRHTALRTMTELTVIGLVETYEQKGEHDRNYTKHIRLKEKFNWFLTSEFERLREGFVPVDNSEFMEDKRRKGTNAEKSTPYTHDNEISADQFTVFLSISEEIEQEQKEDYSTMEVDKGTFGGAVLKQRLVETGKFDSEQATNAIEIMIQRGKIKQVSYDTYRLMK